MLSLYKMYLLGHIMYKKKNVLLLKYIALKLTVSFAKILDMKKHIEQKVPLTIEHIIRIAFKK